MAWSGGVVSLEQCQQHMFTTQLADDAPVAVGSLPSRGRVALGVVDNGVVAGLAPVDVSATKIHDCQRLSAIVSNGGVSAANIYSSP